VWDDLVDVGVVDDVVLVLYMNFMVVIKVFIGCYGGMICMFFNVWMVFMWVFV